MDEDAHGPDEHGHGHDGHGSNPLRHGADQPMATHHDAPAGLTIAANGLSLSVAETVLRPGEAHEWAFRILDDDGDVVTSFDEQHGEPLHLVVVRRDLVGFQHLHPAMAPDGTWSQSIVLPEPGVYRAFADVSVEGRSTTLGVDVFAPGEMDADVRPDFARSKRVDGFEVSFDADALDSGVETTTAFDVVGADGSPAALEPYLEAFGHLVALREGDLAYLHVHPTGADPGAGRLTFQTTFPTRGRYRLFLQVRPGGDLVTTWFDVLVDGGGELDR